MASSSSSNTKVVSCFCFLFLLVLFMASHELGGVEGRRLRSEHCKQHCSNVGKKKAAAAAAASKVAYVDAFRPTAPGHSPGVGHSVHNQVNCMNVTLLLVNVNPFTFKHAYMHEACQQFYFQLQYMYIIFFSIIYITRCIRQLYTNPINLNLIELYLNCI